MICEKCGAQNIGGVTVCTNCNAPMAPMSKCGGFGDILDFESINASASATTGTAVVQGGYNEEDMRNLLNKTDNVIRQNDRNAKISSIAAFVSVIVLICSLIFGLITINYLNNATEKIEALEKTIAKEKQPENEFDSFLEDSQEIVDTDSETVYEVEKTLDEKEGSNSTENNQEPKTDNKFEGQGNNE